MKVDVYSASSHESGTQEFCEVAKEDDTSCIHTQRFIFIYCYRHLNVWGHRRIPCQTSYLASIKYRYHLYSRGSTCNKLFYGIQNAKLFPKIGNDVKRGPLKMSTFLKIILDCSRPENGIILFFDFIKMSTISFIKMSTFPFYQNVDFCFIKMSTFQ